MNTELAGRLHPLLVHFPIGFLFLAFLLEVLSNFKRFRKVRGAVPVAVFMGTAAAVFSVISGLILSEEGGYEPDLLFRHRLFGIMTAAVAIMLWVIITFEKNLPKPKRRPVRLSVFFVLAAVLIITGNFGGSITHGRGYLSDKQNENDLVAQAEKPNAPSLVYRDIVKPIMDKKCVSCHGLTKQKGKLRLDTEESIKKGGKTGSIFPDVKSKGEMIRRIHLPVDDDDHMPPLEKIQLTSTEVEILSEWLLEKDPFEVTVDQTNSQAVFSYNASFTTTHNNASFWPTVPIEPAPEKSLKKLTLYGVRFNALGQESNYLEIKVPTDLRPDPAFWQAYQDISQNVVSLDLKEFRLSNEDFEKLVSAGQIRKLYLNHARLENISLDGLMNLKYLHYLNLVGVGLGYEKIKFLSDHSSLQEVFAYGNKLSNEQVAEFNLKNSVRLEIGNHRLPFRSTDTLVFRP